MDGRYVLIIVVITASFTNANLLNRIKRMCFMDKNCLSSPAGVAPEERTEPVKCVDEVKPCLNGGRCIDIDDVGYKCIYKAKKNRQNGNKKNGQNGNKKNGQNGNNKNRQDD